MQHTTNICILNDFHLQLQLNYFTMDIWSQLALQRSYQKGAVTSTNNKKMKAMFIDVCEIIAWPLLQIEPQHFVCTAYLYRIGYKRVLRTYKNQ